MKVIVHNALVRNGNRVENLIVPDAELKQYFLDTLFYAEYDGDIGKTPLAVLNIPAVSSILHFAVAVGADVETGELDEAYVESAMQVQAFLKSCPGFETLKCQTRIRAKPVRTATGKPSFKRALLFSGGADSTCSWLAHRHENPMLIMIWGLDVPTGWTDFWTKIRETYKHMPHHEVKTNSEDMYRTNKLYELGCKLTEGYRPTYSFSVNALGICAPLTWTERFDELMLSSTYPSRQYLDPDYPWTIFRPNFITNQMWRWADTRCAEIDHQYTTAEKIKCYLKPYLARGGHVFLRSCGHRALLKETGFERLNCGLCDKCQRVIGMLIVNGVDPSKCGFPSDPETYAKIRRDIETRTWNPVYLKYHWKEVQGLIPMKVEEDYDGSKAFLQWLRNYRFW